MSTAICIRPIRPDDRHDMQRALQDGRVSAQSLYRRFHAVKPKLTASELDYLTVVDGYHHLALVATPADRPDHLLGIARAIRTSSDPSAAEIAVIVADRYHGQGIATRLMGALCDRAREVQISRLVALVQGDNRPVIRLLRRFGGRSNGAPSALCEIVVDLAGTAGGGAPLDEKAPQTLAAAAPSRMFSGAS